jgi:hypothetical protein
MLGLRGRTWVKGHHEQVSRVELSCEVEDLLRGSHDVSYGICVECSLPHYCVTVLPGDCVTMLQITRSKKKKVIRCNKRNSFPPLQIRFQ